jgi:hypothetical protein
MAGLVADDHGLEEASVGIAVVILPGPFSLGDWVVADEAFIGMWVIGVRSLACDAGADFEVCFKEGEAGAGDVHLHFHPLLLSPEGVDEVRVDGWEGRMGCTRTCCPGGRGLLVWIGRRRLGLVSLDLAGAGEAVAENLFLGIGQWGAGH